MPEGLDPKRFAEARLSARSRRVAVLRRRVIGTAAAGFAVLVAALGFQELNAGALTSSASRPAAVQPTAAPAAGRTFALGEDGEDGEELGLAPLATAPAPAPIPAPLVTSQS